MRPGHERYHAITIGKAVVFGPTTDALVRDIHARIAPAEAAGFQRLIEDWPFDQAGPLEPDALYHQLLEIRGRTAAPPPPVGTPAGSLWRGALGGVLGGLLGLALGFCAFLIIEEFLLRSSTNAMWAIILMGMLAGLWIGGQQGLRPSRWGSALQAGLVGFVLAGVLAAVAAMFLAAALGEAFGVSQREGAFAMGVVFTIMPLAGLLGGLAFGIYRGRRAWRIWGG